MSKEKVQELLNDEGFVKSLADVKSIEDFQKAFADKGVDLSVDEVQELAKEIAAAGKGELSDDDLENVAGGVSSNLWKRHFESIIKLISDSLGTSLEKSKSK